MSSLREIFVKAVCARGRRTFVRSHRFRTKNHPDDLLGCRVTNHRFSTRMEGARVTVVGSYDIHMWYSYSSIEDDGKVHTAVSVQTVDFEEHVPVEYVAGGDGVVAHAQARVTATRHPRAAEVSLDADGVVQVAIEDGYAAEVIGDTTLWVPAYAGGDEFADKKKGHGFWETADEFDGAFDDEFDDELDFDVEDDQLVSGGRATDEGDGADRVP